jgi:hypothetical protein
MAVKSMSTPDLGSVSLLRDHMLVAGEKNTVELINGNHQDKTLVETGLNLLGLYVLAIRDRCVQAGDEGEGRRAGLPERHGR